MSDQQRSEFGKGSQKSSADKVILRQNLKVYENNFITWRDGLRPRLTHTGNVIKSWGNVKKFFGKTVPLPFRAHLLKWLTMQHQQTQQLSQSTWAKYRKSKKGHNILFGRVPIRKKSISHQQISFLFYFLDSSINFGVIV